MLKYKKEGENNSQETDEWIWPREIVGDSRARIKI